MNTDPRNEKGSAANPNNSVVAPSPAQVQTTSYSAANPNTSIVAPSPAQTQRTNSATRAAVTQSSIGTFAAQDIVAYFFQLVALAIALIFGAWAIKSYDAAETANSLSLIQNQLALLTYCQTDLSEDDLVFCNGITAALPLDSLASTLPIPLSTLLSTTSTVSTVAVPTTVSPSTIFPGSTSSSTAIPMTTDLPAPGTAPSSGATSSPVQFSLGATVGIIVGVVAFVGLLIGFYRWRYVGHKRQFLPNNA